ncbi:hypothetical protein FOZ60_014545 [Perkinsus olseni]|uniref:Uncharacterized protein n=1 Tax=Perkinsus olseni TaxID=32597 RepID=A0A7J6N773_PEROL|nr:hypothetical protein FOZ60_014545 [Perkinsus olseni]
MSLRSVLVLSSTFFLAHGGGKTKAKYASPSSTPPGTTLMPTPPPPEDYRSRVRKDYGDFIYESVGPDDSKLRVILNVTKYGWCMLTVDCGLPEKYEDGWFPARVKPWDDLFEETLVNYWDGDWRHRAKLDDLRHKCPHLDIENTDLQFIAINEHANVGAELGGKSIVLERQWLPLTAGNYVTDYTSRGVDLKIKYLVLPDGYIYAMLGCEPVRHYRRNHSEVMMLRLVREGPGKLYKLVRGPVHTPQDLIDSFMQACPVWRGSTVFKEDFFTAGFLTSGMMYTLGVRYPYNRLYKQASNDFDFYS